MNRKIYFLACVLSLFRIITPVYGQSFYEKYFKDGTYVFDDTVKIRQADIFTMHKSEFGLGIHDEMIQTNNVVTAEGKLTTKYIMKHKGIPVEGSMMNVIGDKGIVLYANGFLRTGLDVDKDNIISEQDAIDAAIAHIDADVFVWEDSAARAGYISEGLDPDSALYPQHAELLITKKRGEEYEHTAENYELCYKVVIHSSDPVEITDVYVNANTGVVFTTQNSLVHDYSTSGTVHTWYNGSHSNIRTRTCTFCSNYWLHDIERNIYTTHNDHSYSAIGDYNTDNNNNWSENETKTAATAHWSVQRAWEYYLNRHNRWGSDYQGRRVHIRTEYHSSQSNAFYRFNSAMNEDRILLSKDGTHPVYHIGQNGYSIAALDIMAHEYTHAMIRASSELGKLGNFEAEALNEGYADIFGILAERYTLSYMDWTIGEATGSFRHLSTPENDIPHQSPSVYLGQHWNIVSSHRAGGVLRKWFYLLSEGGTFNGQTISPLGIHTAEQIAYITFNWWLWSNVKYPEMASQTVHATVAHYGRCSNEHKQVVNSLRAVGLNVPVPFCGGIRLCCGTIIDVRDSTPSGDGIGEWTADISEDIGTSGDFVWHIPDGWSAVAEDNKLTLLSHADNSSRMLSVSYTVDGTTYTDSVAVHFSDEEWEPTYNMPVEPVGKPFENNKFTADNIVLYPNPADKTVRIAIPGFKGHAGISIYNITGSLVKEIPAGSSMVSIATNDLPDGLYLIRVISGDKVYNQKLTIVH